MHLLTKKMKTDFLNSIVYSSKQIIERYFKILTYIQKHRHGGILLICFPTVNGISAYVQKFCKLLLSYSFRSSQLS